MRACTEHAKQQTITCQETWPSNKQTRPRALLEYEIPPILGGIPALKLLPRGPCPSPYLRLHHAPPAPSRALLESPKEGGGLRWQCVRVGGHTNIQHHPMMVMNALC